LLAEFEATVNASNNVIKRDLIVFLILED
jgi:hypothetical protein